MNDKPKGKNITAGRKKLDPMHKRTLRREITLNSIEYLKCSKLMQIHGLDTFRDLFDKLINDAVDTNLDKIFALTLQNTEEQNA